MFLLLGLKALSATSAKGEFPWRGGTNSNKLRVGSVIIFTLVKRRWSSNVYGQIALSAPFVFLLPSTSERLLDKRNGVIETVILY